MRNEALRREVKRVADSLVCNKGMTRMAAADWALRCLAPSVAGECKERNIIGGTQRFWDYIAGREGA